MQFMVTWSIPPSSYNEALERFLSGGAPVPEGMTSLGRWHAPGSVCGWHLVEGDAAAVAQHAAEWAGLLDIDVTPVVDDETAAAAASRALSG